MPPLPFAAIPAAAALVKESAEKLKATVDEKNKIPAAEKKTSASTAQDRTNFGNLQFNWCNFVRNKIPTVGSHAVS